MWNMPHKSVFGSEVCKLPQLRTISKCLLGVALLVAITVTTIHLNATEMSKKIRIVYSGDTMGYWQSCGCHDQRAGGLARRTTAIAQLVKENPNTIIVDSGNLTDLPGKLDVMMSVLAKLKYAAIGLGSGDARLGGEFLSKAKENNLTIIDASGYKDNRLVPYIIKDVGGVKVGIISFGMPLPGSEVDEADVRKARYGAFKAAREKSDILILMDQAGVAVDDWLTRNAARLGSPDIVITGSNSRGIISERVVEKTKVLPSMYQGKGLGVIDVEITPGQAPKLEFRNVVLNEDYPEDAEVDKLVKEGIISLGAATPSQNQAVSQPNPTITYPDGFQPKPYYSPMLCKVCHAREYEDWAKTKHARALKTLDAGKNLTPDCLPCHSELYRSSRSSMAVNDTPSGVECATCHRASLPHGNERKETVQRAKVDPKLCLDCHTKDRSPAYNEKTYFPMVAHANKNVDTTASAPAKQK